MLPPSNQQIIDKSTFLNAAFRWWIPSFVNKEFRANKKGKVRTATGEEQLSNDLLNDDTELTRKYISKRVIKPHIPVSIGLVHNYLVNLIRGNYGSSTKTPTLVSDFFAA